MSVALAIQHAEGMRRTGTSSVACLALPCSPTVSRKQHSKRLKMLNLECDGFCLHFFFSETFLNIRRTERVMVKNIYWSSFKVTDILVIC